MQPLVDFNPPYLGEDPESWSLSESAPEISILPRAWWHSWGSGNRLINHRLLTWPNNVQKHQSVTSQAPFLPPFEGPTKEFNLFSSRVHLQHLAQLQHFPPNWLFMTHGTQKEGDMVTRHHVATAVDTPGTCLRSICRDAVDISILRAKCFKNDLHETKSAPLTVK